MDRHHRLPRSRGGSNDARNSSIVERKLHKAWHMLAGNMTAPEVAAMLTDTWIDADYCLVAVPRKRSNGRRRKRRFCTTCEAEVLKHIPMTEKRSKQ